MKAKAKDAGSSTILVVDDDEDSRRLLSHLLKRRGYEVITADGGKPALAALKKAEVDVILLDVMMPEMDGFAVCRELKKKKSTANIPVILLTARDDMETRATGMNLGVSDFLAKPVNKDELLQRLTTQIEARQLGRELDQAQRRADRMS